MYLDAKGNPIVDLSLVGPLAAGIPGTVRGLEAAHSRFGKLSWARDLAPAIRLARDGFVVPKGVQHLAALARGPDTRPGRSVAYLCVGAEVDIAVLAPTQAAELVGVLPEHSGRSARYGHDPDLSFGVEKRELAYLALNDGLALLQCGGRCLATERTPSGSSR
jgi:hypothetical protein